MALLPCPTCKQPFEIIESTDMQHYFDEEYRIWVTHWITEEFEVCNDCCVTGRTFYFDEFETPYYPDEVSLELWRKRVEKQTIKDK